MKISLITILIFLSATAYAQTKRAECENAYYATGYVKLHQYTVTLTWSKVSDHAYTKFENIIFDNFKVLSTSDKEGKTVYKIRETSDQNAFIYENLLEGLKNIPAKVSCTYDI